MGCELHVDPSTPHHECIFASSGFPLGAGHAMPCGSVYHHGCQRVGHPFHTRLRDQAGFTYPSIEAVPNYTCEACTTRAVLGRELDSGSHDLGLLLLERMRMIDIANRWAANTFARYKYAIRRIRRFEKKFGVAILIPTKLLAPAVTPAIPLQWAHQDYTLHAPKAGRVRDANRVAANTARVLRSAVSQFYDLDMQVAHPGKAVSTNRRTLTVNHVTPPGELSYTFMTAGMNKRLGTASTPPTALSSSMVQFMEDYYSNLWEGTTCPILLHEIASAALVNILAWTSWARSRELFDLRREDLEIILPSMGPRFGLPEHVGAVLITLQESTKGDQARRCDVPVAFVCGSGFSPGKWLQRLEKCTARVCPGNEFLFQDPTGKRWDSASYRADHLIPLLTKCRLKGEPLLAPYDGSKGNALKDKFYSMGCYRRGGQSSVTHRRKASIRIATPAESYEHGRWKFIGKNEAMPVHYTEWTLADRLMITLFCM